MTSALLAAAVLVATAAAPPQPAANSRSELDSLGAVLERAVQRVARPAAMAALQGGTCRAYRLQGYGAMFVLAPRAMPVRRLAQAPQEAPFARALAEAVRGLESSLQQLDSEPMRRQMEATLRSLRQTQERLAREMSQSGETAGRLREAHRLREQELQRQRNELQRELETFRRDAERAREEAERAVAQLAPPGAIPVVPPPAAPAPAAVPAPPAPSEPAEVGPFLAPPAVPAQPPLPPWEMWLEEGDGRSADRLVQDVRTALTSALEARGSSVHGLRPEEYVIVAVDFMPRVGLSYARPERTLLVRVKKKTLDERSAGQLSAQSFRQRIEIVEY